MAELLKIENLTLGFGEKVIFRDINVSEENGRFVALAGSNGRGKSTLLKTLAGLGSIYNKKLINNPDSLQHSKEGSILYKGKKIEQYTKKEFSSLVSFVFPNGRRTNNLSVKDMLSIYCYYRTNWIGAPGEDEEKKISKALEQVGLSGFENRNSASLSDGEYQRVTIAGALVQDSEIILLDEPTAFLDIANKFMITHLLKEIAHANGKLIIFSTHDLQLALDMCNRLWLMTESGFYSGEPEPLMNNGTMDKMFNVPGLIFDKNIKSFTYDGNFKNNKRV
jgi:iron complex transport system ATP-binding protein